MKLNSSRSTPSRSSSGLAVILSASLALCLTSAQLRAQGQPDPKDWDYDIRTDKSTYAAGGTVKATAGVVARKAGVQGWSYGVKHDTAILTIESATSDGTDVPSDAAAFDDATLAIGDRYTDPTLGFTVTVVDSSEASDTVRIAPAGAPTESPAEPTAPADRGSDVAGASPTTLPPTGHDSTFAAVLAGLLVAGGVLATVAARTARRPGTAD